ncbi:MAG: FKBP-type peptidyl-prolyl cis-trans isomerase [Prevotella sp.]|nr:FKBP-type peptidyl-prolyl cis-trans isomerase [Prevotella sp.]MBQ6187814.1 FKBP-type peptidyl-prolyl cis-trans isomerase [Prevotella sp.]
MKKLVIVALVAIVAAGFVSCKKVGKLGKRANVELKNDVDTFAYAVGMAQTQGLADYLTGTLGVDSAYFGDFLKGLEVSANEGASKKHKAYNAGIALGMQVAMMAKNISMQVYDGDSAMSIPMKTFLAGFKNGVSGNYFLANPAAANEIAMAKMSAIKAEYAKEKYKDNKEAGEKWIAEKAKENDVKQIDSTGVYYKVIKEGNGPIPADTSMVEVNYEGKTIDGEVFDTTAEKGNPVTFRVNQVIKGWTEALTRMPVGSKWEVYIPAELAYGERATGKSIKPYSALQFQIELLSVKK